MPHPPELQCGGQLRNQQLMDGIQVELYLLTVRALELRSGLEARGEGEVMESFACRIKESGRHFWVFDSSVTAPGAHVSNLTLHRRPPSTQPLCVIEKKLLW